VALALGEIRVVEARSTVDMRRIGERK